MRLIDLDQLKQNLCGDCIGVDIMNFPKECRQIGCAKIDKQDILEALRVPIIDAVPVIRCKDCKFSKGYYHGSESNLGMFTYLCTQGLYGMNADDYCSRAERKEE